ncbi:hypoxanthine phosphoribosyltransferase [miscellaneous Crenarchaeota group archaeon SMTZ-80]|jgi:hypoxanthine phosphoribosyltransferase|nr:MAG: hypoxanthine phosphoribosyltransferase [miscellaneous Crenarchaeota group archaeon SMTZ-80]
MKVVKKIQIDHLDFELLINQEKLSRRIRQLAKEISRDYSGKVPIFVGVLNGAILFMADLIRQLTIDCEIDFIKISSYGDKRVSSGQITMIKDFSADLYERDIIVVEDIVDSGRSVQYLKKRIESMKPTGVKFVSLLVKKDCSVVPLKIDYVGFEIMNKFVIGYGLDLAQQKRNLNAIYQVKEREFSEIKEK